MTEPAPASRTEPKLSPHAAASVKAGQLWRAFGAGELCIRITAVRTAEPSFACYEVVGSPGRGGIIEPLSRLLSGAAGFEYARDGKAPRPAQSAEAAP